MVSVTDSDVAHQCARRKAIPNSKIPQFPALEAIPGVKVPKHEVPNSTELNLQRRVEVRSATDDHVDMLWPQHQLDSLELAPKMVTPICP